MVDFLNDWSKFDCLEGGAWPFSVRGLICQVYFGNERDLVK